MAEMIIKIGTAGPDPAHQDRDIISVWNNWRVRFTHAQKICGLGQFGYTGDGLRPDSLGRKFMEHTSLFKVERIGKAQKRVTNLRTLEVEEVWLNPNFVTIQARLDNHAIFGVPGAEYWYYKQVNIADEAMTRCWNDIETDTPLREVDFKMLNLQPECLKETYCTLVEDMTDAEMYALVAKETEEIIDPVKGVLITKDVQIRLNQIDYRALPTRLISGRDQDELQDKSKVVDLRAFTKVLAKDEGRIQKPLLRNP